MLKQAPQMIIYNDNSAELKKQMKNLVQLTKRTFIACYCDWLNFLPETDIDEYDMPVKNAYNVANIGSPDFIFMSREN
ncbi:hypothetical protein T11_17378 [Trichinella zimbabwensis]|uniref:Uncharacterized protein n=1 Tax=Trichinella zimbabwensis TaxID=268475 RepID=A0A0V1HN23_9BILA|nr:hypothetical protein T11_17378 [Trichinella zimbabwensis]